MTELHVIYFQIKQCSIEIKMNVNSDDEIPVMVAITRPPSRPQFKCLLLDKKKRFLSVFQELETDDTFTSMTPGVKVSSSETGTVFPFNDRVTMDQASKMLRSDILWVNFEYPEVARVPPPSIRNAFEVLKTASATKTSLPNKYPNPINGLFKLFNKLVDQCKDTNIFFR